MHRVEQIMGGPVVIDAFGVPEAAIDTAIETMRRADGTFSTWRADSEISRLNRGELSREECSTDVREILERCEQLRARTGGLFDHEAAAAFSPRIREQAGRDLVAVEPAGLVKGWAVDRAVAALERAGATAYCVEAAGDMRLGGRPPGEPAWRVGIRHPDDEEKIVAVMRSSGRTAIATSGAYARGDHIVAPGCNRAPAGLRSVTIVGEGNLDTADAYATALFAAGREGVASACAFIPPYEAFIVTADDEVLATPGIRRWREEA